MKAQSMGHPSILAIRFYGGRKPTTAHQCRQAILAIEFRRQHGEQVPEPEINEVYHRLAVFTGLCRETDIARSQPVKRATIRRRRRQGRKQARAAQSNG